MQKSKLTLAVVGALFAMSAEAGTYVLQANKWGAVQEAAVAAAGGTVVYASAGAGLAVVDSDNAAFASAMKASGTVTDVDTDVVLDFDVPKSYEMQAEAGVTLTRETYWNLQWAPRAIEAPAAWSAGYTGANVRVAVIDGGVFAAHPDLSGRVDLAKSRNFTTPTGATAAGCTNAPANWNCDRGNFWHGTHVSGIIAARGDNNTGTVGIAPDATIVALKALHNGSGSFGWIIAAMLYAADEANVSIINMSLGAETPRRQNAGLVAALNRAVNYATAKGSLVVVAAGNSGFDMDKPPASVVEAGVEYTLGPSTIVIPAESGNAIAVSATAPIGYYAAAGSTYAAIPTSYTNYGNSLVWVSGPGGDAAYPGNETCTIGALPAGSITQPCWVFDLVLAPSRAGYSWAAGTSMAAPAAAAVAALIKQKYPNAGPAQLKARLAQSTTDEGKPGQDAMHGHGFINARRAVTQ
jgi:subtilisin family serine protease